MIYLVQKYTNVYLYIYWDVFIYLIIHKCEKFLFSYLLQLPHLYLSLREKPRAKNRGTLGI